HSCLLQRTLHFFPTRRSSDLDTKKVKESQLMIALLDGTAIDSGVASEIGVAYSHQIPILALYTDSRQLGSDNEKKLAALDQTAEDRKSTRLNSSHVSISYAVF